MKKQFYNIKRGINRVFASRSCYTCCLSVEIWHFWLLWPVKSWYKGEIQSHGSQFKKLVSVLIFPTARQLSDCSAHGDSIHYAYAGRRSFDHLLSVSTAQERLENTMLALVVSKTILFNEVHTTSTAFCSPEKKLEVLCYKHHKCAEIHRNVCKHASTNMDVHKKTPTQRQGRWPWQEIKRANKHCGWKTHNIKVV